MVDIKKQAKENKEQEQEQDRVVCYECHKQLPNDTMHHNRVSCCGFAFHAQCLQQIHRTKAKTAKQEYMEWGRSRKSMCPACNVTCFDLGSKEEIKQLLGWAEGKNKAWAYSALGQRYKALKNPPLSFQYYMEAARRGNAVGMKNVGTWYLKGFAVGEVGSGGVEQSKSKAREWWVKAAEKGNENAIACIQVLDTCSSS